ncbi:hypothetical protein [Kitasatospora sp. CB01950]|uniref:hypothetical protein n=1 Tax=Kitasatospora sp. CB01950 TaxID=1703930 RepID=UPI00093917EA|nr:hypothetical protein [Kitasatospora sp. CB01950]OKJ03279.1 hypothetical protein AMK19_26645 [Kitasatospora sp. CB01950]
MITRTSAGLLLLAITTAPANPADAANIPHTGGRMTHGQGVAACPPDSFCLYEHENYNGRTPGRVWVYEQQKHSSAPTPRLDLTRAGAAGFGRSAVANDPGFTTVRLSPNSCATVHDPSRDWEYLIFLPRSGRPERTARQPDLDGVKGIHHTARDVDRDGRQIISGRTLDLDNRARCLLFDESTPGL